MAAGPPIIIKKKVSHGGHHGGAWKVAYADFVTAMMALFIVLWLMNTSKKVQEAVGGYFKDPTGTGKMAGSPTAGAGGEAVAVTKENMAQLKEQLQQSMLKMADFEKLKNQVDMTITAEGLRIEMMETETGTFFDTGKPTPNAHGRELLVMLASELGKIPNSLSIEGHTDSRPFTSGREYGNWELSTDRANSARRLMEQKGLRANQVGQVRGFAFQHLRRPEAPQDASNRRISVIVKYQDGDKEGNEAAKAKADIEGKSKPKTEQAKPSGHESGGKEPEKKSGHS